MIIEQYSNLLHSFLRKKMGVRDFHLREDFVQEVFLRVLQTKTKPHKIKSWLLTIARNVVYSEHRKHDLEPLPPNLFYYDKPIPDFSLAEQHAGYLLLRLYGEGYSLKELAKMFDLKINTVKTRLHRAKKLLRSYNDN